MPHDTAVPLAIRRDDLRGAAVHALLEAHLRDMAGASPPESRHALDLSGLQRPEVRFWCAWDGAQLAGCGALLWLDAAHCELKSMRTAETHRRRGVGTALLQHLLDEAARAGHRRVSLETGAQPFFAPARQLYARFGFVPCAPFGSYREDPNSVFMTRTLA